MPMACSGKFREKYSESEPASEDIVFKYEKALFQLAEWLLPLGFVLRPFQLDN